MTLIRRRETNLITSAKPALRFGSSLVLRQPKHESTAGRTVVASAASVNLADRNEVARLSRYRQAWQNEAWVYKRNLGELRYATNYLGNSCMRLRLYPGVFMPGSQVPVELTGTDRYELPPDLVDAAIAIVNELSANSPIGAQQLQKTLTENFQVAGECWLIGEQLPQTTMGQEVYEWRVRSISEVVLKNGNLHVREAPTSSQNDMRPIDMARTKVSRLWTPDPQWQALADSPFRGILDLAEELLLLGRDVRATVRSRLATNGLLLVPDDLSIVGPEPESDDDEEDAFFSGLLAAAQAAISNEGDAGAAVPIVVRGPSESLSKIQHVKIDRPQNKFNIEQRKEIIERIATGIDLPAEVLTGKVDLNHWSVWQVDDDTFRHHIEPTAIQEVGALTIGYLWRRLDAMAKWAPEIVRKIVMWYDPTELVTHPDRTNDAFQLWDRFALKDDTMRRVAGFADTDAPDNDEMMQRILLRMRSLDPQLQAQILKKLDPSIEIPDSGIEPAGRDTPNNPPPLEPDPGPPPAAEAAARHEALMTARARALDMRERMFAVRSSIIASAGPVPDLTLTRAFVDIDRRLRDRVHTAANTSIRRALERAGARLTTKARGSQFSVIREMTKDVPLAAVPATLGAQAIAAMGITEQQILETEYDEMRRQWDKWVGEAQNQALRDACIAAGLDFEVTARSLSQTFSDDLEEGWRHLQEAMRLAASQLFSNIDDGVEITTTDLITVNNVRAAVGLAGGYGNNSQSLGVTTDGFPADVTEPIGQIGTGDTIMGVMTKSGFSRDGYEWVWGGSMNAFAPHRSLNGTKYTSWGDEVLSSSDAAFPAGGQFFPGDHAGCSCDFMPVLVPPAAG